MSRLEPRKTSNALLGHCSQASLSASVVRVAGTSTRCTVGADRLVICCGGSCRLVNASCDGWDPNLVSQQHTSSSRGWVAQWRAMGKAQVCKLESWAGDAMVRYGDGSGLQGCGRVGSNRESKVGTAQVCRAVAAWVPSPTRFTSI